MDKKNLLSIGELSKLCQITTQALRYYEKINLIKPILIDSETNYRYYSLDQIPQIISIKELKYKGFQLGDIKKFLSTSNLNEIEQIFSKRKKQIEKQIDSLLHYENMLTNRIFYFHHSALLNQQNLLTFHPNHITIKNIPERAIVFVKNSFSTFSLSNNLLLFNEMQNLIKKNKLLVKEPMINIFFGTYEEINTKEMQFEAAYELDKIPEKKLPFIRTISGGNYVSFYHKGNNQSVIETEKKLYQWLSENQYKVCGPLLRCYLITYSICKSIDNVVSEFQIQIEKI